MAVDPKHAGLGAVEGPRHHDPFDDPTEDISKDAVVSRAEGSGPGQDDEGVDAFEPGRVLCGRYELERVAGRGGFCVVFGARDRRREAAGDDDAHVAIKVLRPELRGDGEARHRLTAEFRQLQRLSHPDIVRVFDLDRLGEDWFVVMELLEGVPLAGLIQHCEGGRVPARRALDIVRACAGALGWAHGRGIVHGDVKPGNVFVTRDDGVRLLDFGMASPQPGEGGRVPAFATPAYASPQVLEGGVPAVGDDVFSLGCVAFELLSGVHPFGRVDAREARARGMRPDAAAPLSVPVRAALEAALSFDPTRRPPDMQAFLGLLGPGEASAATPAFASAPVGRSERPAGVRRGRWTAGLVVASLAAAALWWAAGTIDPSRPEAPAPAVPAPAVSVGGGDAVPDGEVPSHAEGAVAQPETAPAAVPATRPPVPVPPAETQQVGFERPSLLVSRSAPAAAIPVRRTEGSTGRVAVDWRIREGSARAGRDFAGPLSGSLVLADGQERATVFIPLLDAAAADDRGFSVFLGEDGGGAPGGSPGRVDVTLRSFVRDGPAVPAARD